MMETTITMEPDASMPVTTPAKREVLPWVLAAVFAVTTILSGVGWLSAAADDGTQAVSIAAIGFVTDLTTWDASDGLQDTVEALRARGTGDFLGQIDEVLGDEARATAEAIGATSRGEVLEVFVSTIEADRAVAVVIVRQTLTVAGDDRDQEQISRIEFQLIEGRWLVARSELLNAPTPFIGGQGNTP
ncbi:MAG: hypothetical protein ACI867_001645 [Glaciecola sp.]|jgi:hypothetical protein